MPENQARSHQEKRTEQQKGQERPADDWQQKQNDGRNELRAVSQPSADREDCFALLAR